MFAQMGFGLSKEEMYDGNRILATLSDFLKE